MLSQLVILIAAAAAFAGSRGAAGLAGENPVPEPSALIVFVAAALVVRHAIKNRQI